MLMPGSSHLPESLSSANLKQELGSKPFSAPNSNVVGLFGLTVYRHTDLCSVTMGEV